MAYFARFARFHYCFQLYICIYVYIWREGFYNQSQTSQPFHVARPNVVHSHFMVVTSFSKQYIHRCLHLSPIVRLTHNYVISDTWIIAGRCVLKTCTRNFSCLRNWNLYVGPRRKIAEEALSGRDADVTFVVRNDFGETSYWSLDTVCRNSPLVCTRIGHVVHSAYSCRKVRRQSLHRRFPRDVPSADFGSNEAATLEFAVVSRSQWASSANHKFRQPIWGCRKSYPDYRPVLVSPCRRLSRVNPLTSAHFARRPSWGLPEGSSDWTGDRIKASINVSATCIHKIHMER